MFKVPYSRVTFPNNLFQWDWWRVTDLQLGQKVVTRKQSLFCLRMMMSELLSLRQSQTKVINLENKKTPDAPPYFLKWYIEIFYVLIFLHTCHIMERNFTFVLQLPQNNNFLLIQLKLTWHIRTVNVRISPWNRGVEMDIYARPPQDLMAWVESGWMFPLLGFKKKKML